MEKPLIIYNSTVKYGIGVWKFLPRKGYKCITVTNKVHEDFRKRAKENNCTMKEFVEYLLAKDKSEKEGK